VDSTGLVTLFRQDMSDEASPPLWSDEELFGYADDAQKMFTRCIGGLADATSALTLIAFDIDQTDFILDPRIMKVRKAYRVSDGSPLAIVNYENMEKECVRFDGKKGPVRTVVLGTDEKIAYLLPIPSVADSIQLLVDRLPLATLTLDDEPQDLEVAEQHHRHLMLWMKALAYQKQDAETFDKSKATEFESKFLAYCDMARKEKDKRKHVPRSVNYGGIPFSTNLGRRSDY
jgi:hypothetical protein